MVTDYINARMGGDPELGLLWLQGASTNQLASIAEYFEIPVYASATRKRLHLEQYQERHEELEEIEESDDQAVEKIANCIDEENALQTAKDFIAIHHHEISADEMSTIADSISAVRVASWNHLKAWLDALNSPSEYDRNLIAGIIVFYMNDGTRRDIVQGICSASEGEEQEDG